MLFVGKGLPRGFNDHFVCIVFSLQKIISLNITLGAPDSSSFRTMNQINFKKCVSTHGIDRRNKLNRGGYAHWNVKRGTCGDHI